MPTKPHVALLDKAAAIVAEVSAPALLAFPVSLLLLPQPACIMGIHQDQLSARGSDPAGVCK